MSDRVISFIRHPYTTRQVLARLLEFWREDSTAPVVMIASHGDIDRLTRNIRVTLSKERTKYPDDARIHYGFLQSEPFPYTDGGVRGEAVVLRWRMTPKQQAKNLVSEFGDLVGQFAQFV